jgi:hypothetical protein
MRIARYLAGITIFIFLLGCGKSSKLAPLLPDAPDGWSADGSAKNQDVSGVGHSSTKSYVPSGSTSGLGVQRVTVQILMAEKGGDEKKLQEMSIEKRSQFKERKEVGGFPAYESFALPSNESHSLDILPKSGTYVQIVAYKGGAGWDKTENRQSVVAAFAGKTDLKKIAAME